MDPSKYSYTQEKEIGALASELTGEKDKKQAPAINLWSVMQQPAAAAPAGSPNMGTMPPSGGLKMPGFGSGLR